MQFGPNGHWEDAPQFTISARDFSGLGLGKNKRTFEQDKVGCIFLMVIWSEFRVGQCRDGDYREDTLYFTKNRLSVPGHSSEEPV